MPRKPSDTVQLNLRVKETLRRALAAEAKQNNRSINAEMAHRLQQSFVDQGVEVLITGTAAAVTREVRRDIVAHLDGVIDEFNRVFGLLGRPDLKVTVKQGGQDD